MAKVPDPVGSLDPRAQALYDHLIAKRGRIDGMYRSLLNHPEFAQRIGELGSWRSSGRPAGSARLTSGSSTCLPPERPVSPRP
jgi:4-carboxymuconolactone decarboxylase